MAEPSNIPPVDEFRLPGMDHELYEFRALPDAPRFDWPNEARIALTVTVMLDYWELQPPADARPDPRIVSPLGKFDPDWLTWSVREYGNRVGIFRVIDMLDRYGITPSVAIGTEAIKRYPELVQAFRDREACFMAHGTFATRRITSAMDEMDEMILLAECADALQRATGTNPAGWCGQDYTESERTPEMLAQAGFTYTTDWSNDDRPYKMTSGLVSLPAHSEWSDLEAIHLRRVAPKVWADGVAEAFAVLHDEGGGCFNLTLHPWVIGKPHHIRYLGDALSRILGRGKVWRTTTNAVASRVAGQLG